MRAAIGGAILVAVLTLVAAPAGAGIEGGAMMTLSPSSPVTAGDEITVANEATDQSRCEGGYVVVALLTAEDEVVAEDAAEPDGSGDWSVAFVAPETPGDYVIEGLCEHVVAPEGAAAGQAEPAFAYDDLGFVVVGDEPTTTTTEAPAGTTTTEAPASTTTTTAGPAAGGVTTPRFTG
jgi:hypothetical protein